MFWVFGRHESVVRSHWTEGRCQSWVFAPRRLSNYEACLLSQRSQKMVVSFLGCARSGAPVGWIRRSATLHYSVQFVREALRVRKYVPTLHASPRACPSHQPEPWLTAFPRLAITKVRGKKYLSVLIPIKKESPTVQLARDIPHDRWTRSPPSFSLPSDAICGALFLPPRACS